MYLEWWFDENERHVHKWHDDKRLLTGKQREISISYKCYASENFQDSHRKEKIAKTDIFL